MAVYAYEVVLSTHDLLKVGVLDAARVGVLVEARDEQEGALLACQMAAAHGMPTDVHLLV